MVIYKDIRLKLTPIQFQEFTVPVGITVLWDSYDFKTKSVVGRFCVSENHMYPEERKNEEFLQKIIDSLGDYVVSTNAIHRGFENVRFGQFSSTWLDHPYLKDVPKDVDVHIADSHNTGSITREELDEINLGIKQESYVNRDLKKYRDERFKPKENSKGEYEVYVGVLEEIP